MNINTNYDNLEQSYLFSTIAKKVNEYINKNPDKKVIRLGIGDVTLPLCKAVIEAMHKAVDEMGVQATFRGYGPEQGYDFLREAVKGYYKSHNVDLELDEIFISDGAKSDLGNILDLFAKDNTVLVPDPVYPVYVDTNIMAGREVKFIDANGNNEFLFGQRVMRVTLKDNVYTVVDERIHGPHSKRVMAGYWSDWTPYYDYVAEPRRRTTKFLKVW
jgi:LL-diaminopimelate aminotransferase